MIVVAAATLLDAALDYARRGWPVFPCHTPTRGGCSCRDAERCSDIGKHPRTEHGLKDATTDETTIRQWWRRWPDANLAIVTGKVSGFFALDGDLRHGGDDTLQELEAQHGPLPETVESQTGGGGFHKLYRSPGYPMKSGAGVLGPGLDVKADGGYIVAPPSLHMSGRRYEWEVTSHPDEVPIAEAPAWLLDKLRPEATNGNGRGFTVGEKIKDGERNNTLYRLVRSLKARELSYEAILAALRAENQAKCQPPLPDAEVEKIAEHATEQPDRPEFAATNGADRQESALTAETPWPTLDAAALQGLAGEIVRAIDPYTEADPVAVLAQLLAFFGCAIGREAHFRVEHTPHPAKLFEALVGATSKGRKGMSTSTLKHLFVKADPDFVNGRIKGGLSSGEGLIYQVRDAAYETQKDKKTGQEQEVMIDKGEEDKRLVILEPELAQALKVMSREGNILSPIMRQAWDDEALTPLTKHNRMTATGSHISIVGHITQDELLKHLGSTETANGFANRFVFLVVKRSKYLPNPKGLPAEQIEELAKQLRERIEQARLRAQAGPIERDEEAEALWCAVYPDLSEGKPGLMGAILGRAEAQVMRLALAYALLDGATSIHLEHLQAALALWDYSEASVWLIFGEATGDGIADRILEALRSQGPLSETKIYYDLFQRNVKSGRIHRAVEVLRRSRLIESTVEETGGRQKTVWRAT